MSESDEVRDTRSEVELAAQITSLSDEIAQLRRREAARVTADEHRAQELDTASKQIEDLSERNRKLLITLKEARSQLLQLREEIDRLAQPPSGYAFFISLSEDGSLEANVAGRHMRLQSSPTVDKSTLRAGQQLRLNEALTVVEASPYIETGQLYPVKEVVDDNRVVLAGMSDDSYIVFLPPHLREHHLKSGDLLLADTKAGLAFERIPQSEVNDLELEEVPDIKYEDVGGLGDQIKKIHDAVELPFLHADLFAQFDVRAPKGVLLYGPPGCGKTLIAKAVANSLAQKMAKLNGGDPRAAKAYFLSVKGPELLNKFVGETERTIRLVFQRAREKASSTTPVIVFFDEMDSVFRTRGTGISSDIESTIVPQLLAELDGVAGLENVIVIGATNREDMIDPAILRPGRLDVKIKVDRPDKQGAADVFGKYILPKLPYDSQELAEHDGNVATLIESMIVTTVQEMYAETDDNKFLEVTYKSGEKEILYFKDFSSGAMIANIVDRAKKSAIKRRISTGTLGIRQSDLREAVLAEFAENEDLPNTTNPDDWARISGRKGEQIVYIRTLVNKQKGSEAPREVRTADLPGQYL